MEEATSFFLSDVSAIMAIVVTIGVVYLLCIGYGLYRVFTQSEIKITQVSSPIMGLRTYRLVLTRAIVVRLPGQGTPRVQTGRSRPRAVWNCGR